MRPTAKCDARPAWITADDFGESIEGNRVIGELATEGRLSAVSVMGHRDAAAEGSAVLASAPIRVGLHLRLTSAWSLGPSAFWMPRWWELPWALRTSMQGRIRDEIRRQADRVLGWCGRIDFVNGHEHVHLFPQLWPLVVETAQAVGATALRAPVERPRRLDPESLLELSAWWARRTHALPATMTATAPLGVRRAGRLHPGAVEALLRRPVGTAIPELCFHPVHLGATTPERELLRSGAIERCLAQTGHVRA